MDRFVRHVTIRKHSFILKKSYPVGNVGERKNEIRTLTEILHSWFSQNNTANARFLFAALAATISFWPIENGQILLFDPHADSTEKHNLDDRKNTVKWGDIDFQAGWISQCSTVAQIRIFRSMWLSSIPLFVWLILRNMEVFSDKIC